jgi:hypothetical protein
MGSDNRLEPISSSAAPKELDRSECIRCHTPATRQRIAYYGPIKAVLCEACAQDSYEDIINNVNKERIRRNLTEQEYICCLNCRRPAPPGARVIYNGKPYCKACGQWTHKNNGQMRPASQYETNHPAKGLAKPRRPKGKPAANACEHCHTRTGPFKWSSIATKDLSHQCRKLFHTKMDRWGKPAIDMTVKRGVK